MPPDRAAAAPDARRTEIVAFPMRAPPIAEYARLLVATTRAWRADDCGSRAAAVAFYTAFSLAPILVIATAIAGFFFERDVITRLLVNQAGGLLGATAATFLSNLLDAAARETFTGWGAAITVATMVFGATSAFVEVKDDLDDIWIRGPRARLGWRGVVHNRLLAFGVVLVLGLLLLVVLMADAGLSAFQKFFAARLGDDVAALARVASTLLSVLGVATVFAAIFRLLASRPPPTKSIWQGALLTTALFLAGRIGVELYLGGTAITTVFGAAASLAVVLLWIYYSAMIFFFGAEFTRLHAGLAGLRETSGTQAAGTAATGAVGGEPGLLASRRRFFSRRSS